MCVKNVEKYIGACITSVLNQTSKDFEFVIIDDSSTDNTVKVVKDFKDKRIKFYKNEHWLGIPKSRNKGVKYASGKYIFFTDGDCVVSNDWIDQGLKYLKDSQCVGVEGAVYYVSKDYKPTFSDHVSENRHGGYYMTGSIAYKKRVFQTVGGFDEKLNYLEDRDFAYKVLKFGTIYFNPEMVTYHQKVTFTPKTFVKSGSNSKYRVHMFKKFNDRTYLLGRILFASNIVKILFPPLIFGSLVVKPFKNSADFKLFPYIYIYLINERLQIWKTSIESRVFIM